VIFDRFHTYEHAWDIGMLIGFDAGELHSVTGGPCRRRDRLATPQLAVT